MFTHHRNEHGNGNHEETFLYIKNVQIKYTIKRRNKLKAISSILSKFYKVNEHLFFKQIEKTRLFFLK
jgi:hypothetical protein